MQITKRLPIVFLYSLGKVLIGHYMHTDSNQTLQNYYNSTTTRTFHDYISKRGNHGAAYGNFICMLHFSAKI